MDVRNIQKTGKMFYIYLPTKWCRKNNVTSASQANLELNNDGSLTVYPCPRKKKPKSIVFNISKEEQDVTDKLMIACYINPLESFKIEFGEGVNLKRLLRQKKSLRSLEFVEFTEDHLTCESYVSVENPLTLLRNMVRKISNLVQVMRDRYDAELIARYEDEIDKSKILVSKAVVNSLTFHSITNLKPIDLHYTSIISRSLEMLVDYLTFVDKTETKFFDIVAGTLEDLKEIVARLGGDTCDIDYRGALRFAKRVTAMKMVRVVDLNTYDQRRVRRCLIDISEMLIDWSVTERVTRSDS
ncbi:MAG: hypothetical protein ABH879_04335 [archaeon]